MSIEYVELQTLGNIITGKTPSTEDSTNWGGIVPFITPTDIVGYDMRYINKTERTVSEVGVRKQKKTLIPKNTICVSCIASIGKMCIVEKTSITNQQINSIVVNKNNDFRYVFYALRYFLPYLQLIGGGTGSGTPIINKNKFSKLKYPIERNIKTQKEIADILSKFDDLIELNNKRIKLLEQTAEEIYKEWFVKFRFPGYENALFEKDIPKGWIYGSLESNSIPVGWHYGQLSELGEFVRGRNITAAEMNEGDIPVISAGLEPSGYHNKANVFGRSITISASGANAGFLKYNLSDIWCADCSYYQNKENIWYVYNSLKFIESVINNLQIGSAQPHVYPKNINRLSIPIPQVEFIKEYNGLVSPIYEEIKILNNSNDNIIKQRDYLLPRLISGNLEVGV